MTNTTNIIKAILAVMQEVKNIDKAMTVGEGRNSYRGVADKDVKSIVGGAMAKHGLIALPISVEPTTKVERWQEENFYNGQSQGMKTKQSVFTEVKTRYLLMHESGESIEIEGIGHGVDPQDKAAGKATTYALKNALLYSFLVPTGHIDDTDATHSDNIATPQNPTSQTAAQAKKPKPLKQGTELWTKVVDWLTKNMPEKHKVKTTYIITDEDYDAIVKEAEESLKAKEMEAIEAIDAIKAADDMATLTKIFNECKGLHSNKAFVDAYAARQKELAKLGKAA